MSHSARPIKSLVVSADVAVLHDLAWMLTAVGYSVETSKDHSENAAWRQFSDAEILFFDGRAVHSPAASLFASESAVPVYRFVLYDTKEPSNLAAWFSAGANDALRIPLSRGELLARTRAAARALEFERRMIAQSCQSNLPGTYSVRGFVQRVGKLIGSGEHSAAEHTLLTVGIDFIDGITRRSGASATDWMLSALSTLVRMCAGERTLTAYEDAGTFHILLIGHKPERAREIAEQISQAFRTVQTDRQSNLQTSLSIAVVPWERRLTPDQHLLRGRDTLTLARQSGGDCIVTSDSYSQELSNWQTELTVGSPFANVIAQDIMEPFPYVLIRNRMDRERLAALRRSGVTIWPFVNDEGRLEGVVMPSAHNETLEWREWLNDELALVSPVTVAHDATFPEIYDTFSEHGCLEIVVLAEQRPIGYLTFNAFISLIEPIDSATYASDETVEDDLRRLLVGSAINGSEPVYAVDP